MADLTVEVTELDIEQGETCSPGLCPIALASDRAMRSLFGAGVAVSVGGSMIEVWVRKASRYDDLPDFSVEMPEHAKDFIAAFDSREDEDGEERRHWPTPAPFTFMVTVPDPVNP